MTRDRWLVVLALACVVVAAAAVAYAAGKADPTPMQEVVRAKRLELVDSSGRVRAALRFKVGGWPRPGTEGNSKEEIEQEEMPELVMFDEQGTERAHLIVDRHGSWFGLHRETGKLGAMLDASYRNNGLAVFDMNEKVRVAVEAGERFPHVGVYRHGLVLLGDDGEQVAGLVANAESEPRLTLVTPEGRELSAP
jgi:hypothetical protein